MPDLQTALTQALNQANFDDEDPTPPQIMTNTQPTPNKSKAAQVWDYVKEHPRCTSGAAASALGLDSGFVATAMSQMQSWGRMTRELCPHTNKFLYSTAREAMTKNEAMQLAVKARSEKLAAAKPKAAPKPTPKSTPEPIKWLHEKPVPRKEFDAKALVEGLTVKQAKELMAELKAVFAA